MTTPIDSAIAFRAAINTLVREAVLRRARHLWLVDLDFQDWPFDEAVFFETLTEFVQLPGRRVQLLGRHFDTLARSAPRLAAWRRTWGHTMDVTRPVDEEAQLPTVALADNTLAVQLLDHVHWRGLVFDGDPQVHVLAHEIDALMQRTEPTFGTTTLGL